MFYQLVVALLALSVIAAAYEFHDEHFNELLADQSEEWDRSPRSRRENVVDEGDSSHFVKCKQHHAKSCCGKGKWLKHFGEKGKQYVGDCVDQLSARMNASGISLKMDEDPFSCARVNLMKMKVICTTECVGKKMEVITEDGSLSLQKALGLMEKMDLEDWQKPLVEDAINKCAPAANNTKLTTASTGSLECNPVLLNMQHCLFQEVQKNCPETERNKDARCKKLQDNLNANKILTV